MTGIDALGFLGLTLFVCSILAGAKGDQEAALGMSMLFTVSAMVGFMLVGAWGFVVALGFMALFDALASIARSRAKQDSDPS